MSWFALISLATILFGIQSFLIKSSAERGCDKFIVSLTMVITQGTLGVSVFLIKEPNFEGLQQVLFGALILAIVYFNKLILDFKTMEYLPANKALPIISSNVFLVVLYGMVFFNEKLYLNQLLGIVIIILSVILINIQSSKHENYSTIKVGFIFAMLSMLLSAATNIINKYAVMYFEPLLFNAIVQFFLIIVSFVALKINRRKEKNQNIKQNFGKSIKLGIILGIILGTVGSIAYISFLFSLTKGPLSIISPVLSLSVIIAVILARVVYKEELTKKQIALVLLSVLGVMLVKADMKMFASLMTIFNR